MNKSPFQITKETIREFIITKEKFSPQELRSTIIKRGGILRMSLYDTLSDFLDELSKKGIIKMDYTENTTTVVSKEKYFEYIKPYR